MARYAVGFFNDLPDSTGHDHHVCQRTIEIAEAGDPDQAIARAIPEFERLENVCDWRLHARSIECEPKGEAQ